MLFSKAKIIHTLVRYPVHALPHNGTCGGRRFGLARGRMGAAGRGLAPQWGHAPARRGPQLPGSSVRLAPLCWAKAGAIKSRRHQQKCLHRMRSTDFCRAEFSFFLRTMFSVQIVAFASQIVAHLICIVSGVHNFGFRFAVLASKFLAYIIFNLSRHRFVGPDCNLRIQMCGQIGFQCVYAHRLPVQSMIFSSRFVPPNISSFSAHYCLVQFVVIA